MSLRSLRLVELAIFASFIPNVLAVSGLSIQTDIGTITGFTEYDYPNVAQFLGVPFAEPPLGDLRWLPPTPKLPIGGFSADQQSPACPQYESSIPSVYDQDARQFLITPGLTSEDCLTLNIWVPLNATEPLPVLVWIYGGAFQTGGGNIAYQIPTAWVERSQKHIVVGINYRVNIFGFPNAAGLNQSELNLGLLDQRAGIQWVHDNIAAFGGDTSRISMWGQSAGSWSVDIYNFGYPNNSYLAGHIMDSGSAVGAVFSSDSGHTNFSFVANWFNCPTQYLAGAQAELECMRTVHQNDIEAFLKYWGDLSQQPPLGFYPVIDDITTFPNYTARALAGNFTKNPAIVGTNSDEGRSLVAFSPTGVNLTLANLTTEAAFLCPAVVNTANRYAAGAETFRYLYDGNFSNIAPRPWEGAYHSSELPLIFGTSDIVRGANTPFETQLSELMQDLYLAFISDPQNGLPSMGWPAYSPNGSAVLLGQDDQVLIQNISVSELAAPCNGLNPIPGAIPPS